MKLTIALLPVALAFAAAAEAQNGDDKVTRYVQRDGTEVEVHSGQPGRRPAGPPPAFAQLDVNGDGMVDEGEARGYDLLANDLIYADGNRDGRVSAQEYARWTAQR